MKALLSACALSCLLCMPAAAQRGGFGHGGGGFVGRPGVPAGTVGIPPLGNLPPMGSITTGTGRFARGRGLGAGFGGGWGWFPGLYDAGYDNTPYQAAPSLVVVTPEMLQPPPPARPVQGEVHEYTKTNSPEAEAGPPAEFALVSKDHITRAAVAVWAQDGILHYLDSDGAARTMPLGTVDREATRQANAAKGLRLQIPAE